ncbi:MAG TPA: 3-hydroxyacyl-CoA dehydrogenase NAD-binding domain-containing protein [Acidobacteriaceae bacterium]
MTQSTQSSIRTVAIIGAGTAGRSFALACVRAGFHVFLEDVMPANLRRAQDDYAGAASNAVGSLSTALTVEDAVRSADLAIDFVPDELESKLEIFSMLDRMAPPRTILLTPSDAQSITDLASCTYRPARCFAIRGGLAAGAPAHLVHPPDADPTALAATVVFLRAVGNSVEIEPDPIAPMLIKNQARS